MSAHANSVDLRIIHPVAEAGGPEVHANGARQLEEPAREGVYAVHRLLKAHSLLVAVLTSSEVQGPLVPWVRSGHVLANTQGPQNAKSPTS